jgi:hypothetical protein
MPAPRRLRALGQHLAASPTAHEDAAAPRRPVSPHLAGQLTLPRQLEQDDRGVLVAADAALLEGLDSRGR